MIGKKFQIDRERRPLTRAEAARVVAEPFGKRTSDIAKAAEGHRARGRAILVAAWLAWVVNLGWR